MRGEFIPVWSETWSAIWLPLADSEAAPSDMFCELYRELAAAFAERPSIEKLAEIIDSQQESREAFEHAGTTQFESEKALVRFLENAHDVLQDLQGDQLANCYFGLLSDFIEKYSLGYSLRRPCALSPTLPGMFADIDRALRRLSSTNEHLAALHHAHDEAIKDLRFGATEERIKTCISKQVNLMEALAATADEVTKTTLGDMCDQLNSWPHATIKESLKKIYGFASNYPGIRHGGNPAGRIRSIEANDLAAISVVLLAYAPYLASTLETTLASLVES